MSQYKPGHNDTQFRRAEVEGFGDLGNVADTNRALNAFLDSRGLRGGKPKWGPRQSAAPAPPARSVAPVPTPDLAPPPPPPAVKPKPRPSTVRQHRRQAIRALAAAIQRYEISLRLATESAKRLDAALAKAREVGIPIDPTRSF